MAIDLVLVFNTHQNYELLWSCQSKNCATKKSSQLALVGMPFYMSKLLKLLVCSCSYVFCACQNLMLAIITNLVCKENLPWLCSINLIHKINDRGFWSTILNLNGREFSRCCIIITPKHHSFWCHLSSNG